MAVSAATAKFGKETPQQMLGDLDRPVGPRPSAPSCAAPGDFLRMLIPDGAPAAFVFEFGENRLNDQAVHQAHGTPRAGRLTPQHEGIFFFDAAERRARRRKSKRPTAPTGKAPAAGARLL